MKINLKRILHTTVLFTIAGSLVVACGKKEPKVPSIPPGTGPTPVVLPDTSLPLPGPKVRWVFLEPGATAAAGTFKLINVYSGKMANAADVNATAVTQLSQNGSDNQKWQLISNGNGTFKIKNSLTNKVLSAKNCSGTIDSVVQKTEAGTNCEHWSFESINTDQYKLLNAGTGKYLSVNNSSVSNDAIFTLATYSGSDGQHWRLYNIPTMALQEAYSRITASMDKAAARYNKFGNFDKYVTVVYEPAVPTADANFNGRIRFGANPAHQGESTALHEMGHTMGVGTNSRWGTPLIAANSFIGAKTLLWIKYFDGPNGIINTDGQHFWPYGMNFATEFNETNADRHVRIIWAMKQDGL